MAETKVESRYLRLIEGVFFDLYRDGLTDFEFAREDLEAKAQTLGIVLPKNLGDVVYSIRYRTALPERILETQSAGREWIIEGAGRARYRFRLVAATRIRPRGDLVRIGIPDATPELIRAYALDEPIAVDPVFRPFPAAIGTRRDQFESRAH